MGLMDKLFGKSPFKPLHEHAKKVHECVHLIPDAMESMFRGEFDTVREIQDTISKHEHEADVIEQEIRNNLSKNLFTAIPREDICEYLSLQDDIADAAEDVAVTLILRKTEFRNEIETLFRDYVTHITDMTSRFLNASEEMENLAETVFRGTEAEKILGRIQDISKDEWTADRMQRDIVMRIYEREDNYNPITLMFYEKILRALDDIANSTDRTANMLRRIILTNK